MIKISDLRQRMQGGFQPFVVRTTDGREFKVPHPEFIALASWAISVVDEQGGLNTIPLLHIASIRDIRGRKKGSQAA